MDSYFDEPSSYVNNETLRESLRNVLKCKNSNGRIDFILSLLDNLNVYSSTNELLTAINNADDLTR